MQFRRESQRERESQSERENVLLVEREFREILRKI